MDRDGVVTAGHERVAAPGGVPLRKAEARGFDSLWFPEHSHIPVSRRTPWGGREGAPPLPEEYWRTHDQFIALAAIAGATSSIKLGTGIKDADGSGAMALDWADAIMVEFGAPVAQAVTTEWFGPLRPWRIETCPEARLISRPLCASQSPSGTTIAALGKEIRYLAMALSHPR